ncbi:MAG: hypothetical protein Q4E16_00560 [Neisseria sp.]|nr:hypothetical protein [Neisseria sp.]
MQKIVEWTLILLIFAVINLIGNQLGSAEVVFGDATIGMLILLAITVAGMALAEFLPFKLPSIGYITIIAVVLALPQMPTAEFVVRTTSQISLLSITTPILAYAGISIGRNWADFTKLGWRALIVACLVFIGTYLGSAVVAEIVLRYQGLV